MLNASGVGGGKDFLEGCFWKETPDWFLVFSGVKIWGEGVFVCCFLYNDAPQTAVILRFLLEMDIMGCEE
ncbi:hypothetical protein CEXT_668241 [Caerostris extrusa]|uniref:Uncharacterized protein n=1 Tax=Caerostris extrusa TaxID=172846 RepID=A0AAV4Q9Q6_CAEEX|nr:hypothetical protein CEXT_668241 [Caerostris extrusa]